MRKGVADVFMAFAPLERERHARVTPTRTRADMAETLRWLSDDLYPDNSAMEGFFGRMKVEMFYGRSWKGVSITGFMEAVDSYIRWYNSCRIKVTLGGMSPLQYRESLGIAA